jgi:hypothetical protein
VLVNYIRDYQIDHGVARAQAYSVTMFVLAALLALGFVCNWLIKPVSPENYMTPEQITADDQAQAANNRARPANTAAAAAGEARPTWLVPAAAAAGEARPTWLVPAAWLAVWMPLGWGIWVTLQKAVLLLK